MLVRKCFHQLTFAKNNFCVYCFSNGMIDKMIDKRTVPGPFFPFNILEHNNYGMPVESMVENKTKQKVIRGKKFALGSFKLNEKSITHKYANVLLQSLSQYVQPRVRTRRETADGGAQGAVSEDPELAHHRLPEATPSLQLHLYLHQNHPCPVRVCRSLTG